MKPIKSISRRFSGRILGEPRTGRLRIEARHDGDAGHLLDGCYVRTSLPDVDTEEIWVTSADVPSHPAGHPAEESRER